MSLFFSPVCNDQTLDANGDPLVGGQIETYIAGSSTPAATYTDESGGTPQSNPIILNSLGYPTLGPIWLTGGQSYKFIIKDALGVTLRTIDDISGVNDASVSQSEWVVSGFTPTYINATSFSVPGDQTAVLQVNRRLRTTNTSGLIYSTITNSVFASGITTVTVLNDSGVLDAGISVISYGLLSSVNPSVPAIFVPTGAVVPFAMNTPPTGWLKANGAAVSRTTYAALFTAIGTTFGVGDGSTTFNLPDLRGEFVRGWDDGRGVDSARAFGSAQSSQNLSHSHTGSTNTTGSHTHGTAGDGINVTAGGQGVRYWGDGVQQTGSAGSHSHTLTINTDGGTEARPRNIALLFCIKY